MHVLAHLFSPLGYFTPTHAIAGAGNHLCLLDRWVMTAQTKYLGAYFHAC